MLFRRLAILLFLTPACLAQTTTPPQPDAPVAAEAAPITLFPHSDSARYLISGQTNIVFQAHAPFHADYSGANSLLDRGEYKTSLVGTLFLGYQIIKSPRFALDAIYDEESAGGRGISEALGLAGFTNLDVVRNPSLGSTPYAARYELHQVIGLSGTNVETERTPFSLATSLPVRRIEFWVGRMGIPDFFDLNSVGTDSHLQFLNWTVDNNGAWDYAANTRGYTDALVAQYTDHAFTARYAIAAMPTVANGIDLDYAYHRASGQNAEFEYRDTIAKRKGAVRLLGFVNHANMGDYRDQINLFLAHKTATPDITAHPQQTTVKYGIGLNAEQELSENIRVFGRFGWNEGQHESYAYTEVDQTMSLGADYSGKRWRRDNDKIGLTFVSNAIKKDHQNYLKLGGLGFLLGDGNLNYAREDIVEAYYNYHLWRGVYYAFDEQFVTHPGYNKDRGPIMVETVRMHVDF
jgi:hypothetical protein